MKVRQKRMLQSSVLEPYDAIDCEMKWLKENYNLNRHLLYVKHHS